MAFPLDRSDGIAPQPWPIRTVYRPIPVTLTWRSPPSSRSIHGPHRPPPVTAVSTLTAATGQHGSRHRWGNTASVGIRVCSMGLVQCPDRSLHFGPVGTRWEVTFAPHGSYEAILLTPQVSRSGPTSLPTRGYKSPDPGLRVSRPGATTLPTPTYKSADLELQVPRPVATSVLMPSQDSPDPWLRDSRPGPTSLPTPRHKSPDRELRVFGRRATGPATGSLHSSDTEPQVP
jgi:hypothetical protein